MTKTPLFRLQIDHHQQCRLHLVNVSLLNCLACFKETETLEINDMGATCYQQYGWASKDEMPLINTVAQLRDFLLKAGDIGLYTLSVTIANAVILEFVQPFEPRIHFKERAPCMAFIKAMLPDAQQNRIINALIKNPDCFIHSDLNGEITRYASIDEFQAKHG
jgi:hypothetical protein